MFKKIKVLNTFITSLLILFLFSSSIIKSDTTYVSQTTYKYINDYVGILNTAESKSIISIGKELEDKTQAQAVVVIIDSTNNIPIETYANELFRQWGIGQKDQNNGLLMLIAINDRAWRVEVGSGLEGAIPDALSNRIMDSLAKPSFSNNDYATGIIESYSSMCDYIAKEYDVTLTKSLNISLPNDNPSIPQNRKSSNILIISVVLLLFLDLFLNKGRVSSTIMQLIFLSNLRGRNGPRGGSGGGGFGGFGGGSSNGGGSSGRW